MTYNRFMQGLKLAGIELDRRVLAELAVNEPAAFAALVETARAAARRRPGDRRRRRLSPRRTRSCADAVGDRPSGVGAGGVVVCPERTP